MKRKMSKWLAVLILAAFFVMAISGCGKKDKADNQRGLEQTDAGEEAASGQAGDNDEGEKTSGDAAGSDNWFAELETTDIDGNPVTAEIFAENKLTLINTWATFCGPCIREMPELEALYQEYADVGVGFAGLLVDSTSTKLTAGLTEEDKEAGELILEKTGVTYPQLTVSEGLLETDFIMLNSFPTTYFVDKDGNFVGEPVKRAWDKDSWREIIEERLKMVEE